MTQLLISIKTLSPLYVGALKPYGSFLETHAEIPGSLLRGAVAQKTLPDCVAPELINNHEACIVKEICPFYYLTTVVAFPTCAIAEGGHRAEPPLRTMVTCKAAPGFASQSTTREPKHGVFDTLLRHLVFHELRCLGVPPDTLPPQRCGIGICEAPLEPFAKRYVKEASGRYHAVPSLDMRRMTHVGINRRRESAERGLLYAVQSIAERTQFIGCMTVPESWDEKRVAELRKVLESITRLGGEQTYGLGSVEITVKETDGDAEDVPTRVNKLNEKLNEVWNQYSAKSAPAVPEGQYLTVDLLTPALLTMPDGTPTVQLTADMLRARAAELGLADLPDLEQVRCPDDGGVCRSLMFTAPMIVSGWSEAWGLPKPPALAVVAGSVYVFRTNDISAWRDALIEIEVHGIGARREEGFGAVRICDPFHREVKPV